MRSRFATMLLLFGAACTSAERPIAVTLDQVNEVAAAQADETSASLEAFGNAVNAALEAQGAAYRLHQVEWITDDQSDAAGNVFFFADVGNKKLPADFVPGDARRVWNGGTGITYTIDQREGMPDGLTQAETNAAIDRAMASWDGVQCSTIPIESRSNPGTDIGFTEFLFGHGGAPFVFADLMHAGWEQPSFFALVFGPFGANILAATFTYAFVGPGGPTDIDNNKYADVAFREINYNDAFVWRINANFDVESVALHEAGHGLSQAHFGQLFLTTSNAKFHFAPRAVMNAGYTGVQQILGETDNAGHCANWASWPNK